MTVKAPTLYVKPGSFVIGKGSADSINCHGYNGVIHGGRGIGGVVVEGIVSLDVYSGDGAFYALKLPPLIIKSLGILDPIVYVHRHVREPVDLLEDFGVYDSTEVIDCRF